MLQIKEGETTDEVIRETRRIKEVLAQSMDFGIDRILNDAGGKQKNSGRTILNPPALKNAQEGAEILESSCPEKGYSSVWSRESGAGTEGTLEYGATGLFSKR